MHLLRYLTLSLILAIVGCGSGETFHPIQGKFELPGGDLSALAGCTIEAIHDANPLVRASGAIQADGSFFLETLKEGVIHRGAAEGTYRLRIILSDDDPASRRKAARAVARRLLEFDTSGLSLRVPSGEKVVLQLPLR